MREDGSEANVWLAELAGTSAARRLTFSVKNRAPIWSGDSQWIIFQSDREATGASGHPAWSSAGNAILTSIAINRDTAIPVITTPRFVFGRPDEYPHGARLNGNPTFTRRNFDPLPDGRILGVMSVASAQSGTVDAPQIAVVLNWFDALRQRVR